MTRRAHHKIVYSSLSIGIALVLLSGCNSAVVKAIDAPQTKQNESNKITINAAIQNKQLELADKKYLTFRGLHPESDRLPGLILTLSKAHMEAKEYLLARYYAEAYIRDYPSGKRVDEAWFLRIKSIFLRFKHHDSSEVLAEKLKEESQAFLSYFTRSKYRNDIKKMRKESQRIIKAKNEEIALAYERMGKKKAAAYYRKKNKK